MNFWKRALVLAASLLSISAFAITQDPAPDDRDYRVIVDRNPFGVKPPPPLPTNAPAVAQTKDELYLTGITSIGGARAYFMSKAPQGKQPEFYSLGVDEKKNGLEVLSIDLDNRSVRVRNGGAESLMTFAANGVKAPAAPTTPVATPGAPHPPGAAPLPGAPTAAGAVAPPGAQPGLVAGAIHAGTPATTTSGRIRTIPSRNMRTPPALPNAAADPAVRPNPDAAVQDVLMMELQKRANPGVPFPPTPMPE